MSDYYDHNDTTDLPLFDQGIASRNETFREILPTLSERERQWLYEIQERGTAGATLDELSAATGLAVNTFSGRVTALAKRGLVIRTTERRPTRAGSTASVIVAKQFFKEPEKE